MRTKRLTAAVIAVALMCTGSVAVAAVPTSIPQMCAMGFASQQQPFTGDAGGRFRSYTVDGRKVLVLEPRGFDRWRNYPVVYLFHGGAGIPEAWLSETSLVTFTDGLPDDQQAIVVMPDGKLVSTWTDWHDGSYHDEALFMNHIAPFIDSYYRTFGAARRAAAGFSAGGLGAFHLASRHPGFFSAVASFSGAINYTAEPREALIFVGASSVIHACNSDPIGLPGGIFGDPVTDPANWNDNDPAQHPERFAGQRVDLYVGAGSPCDTDDVQRLATEFPIAEFEPFLAYEAANMDRALTEAGVPHGYVANSCGLHSYKYVDQYLQAWWPHAIAPA